MNKGKFHQNCFQLSSVRVSIELYHAVVNLSEDVISVLKSEDMIDLELECHDDKEIDKHPKLIMACQLSGTHR